VSVNSYVPPERVLLKYIQGHWGLEVEGVTACEVMFTDKDYPSDNCVYAPTVCVQQAGARRKQVEEDDLYDFTFVVKVSLWSRWSKIPSDCDTRLLHGLMVDHLKKMFSIQPKQCPEGWVYVYVESTANVALMLNLLPELNEFNVTVKAVIPWI
jgi:hypothetical protein